MELTAEEMRVLGSLVEKQLTTPAQYPLTLNALTLACNQTSSRNPIVSYDERTVEATVTAAKTRGLARFVHPSHGRSALRFAHSLDEALGLDPRQLALLAVLMLRGPQTVAELRTRTERMAEFADAGDLEAELDALCRRDEPFATRLERRPGQKEERYIHLLGAWATEAAAPGTSAPAPAGASPSHAASRAPGGASVDDSAGQVAALVAHVAALQAEVASVRRDVDDLRAQLGV